MGHSDPRRTLSRLVAAGTPGPAMQARAERMMAGRDEQADIALRVLTAWAVGLSIAGAVYVPVVAVAMGGGLSGLIGGLTLMPLHLVLSYTYGAMISLPLVALWLAVALVMGPRAASRPWLWAGLCAAVAAGGYAMAEWLIDMTVWPEPLALATQNRVTTLWADMVVMAVAAFGGALYYCLRLRAAILSADAGQGDGPP